MTIFDLFSRNYTASNRPARKYTACNPLSLSQVKHGERVQIRGFSSRVSPERRMQLRSYGVMPGRWVSVAQHSPVTVVQVEHTELALETELAREVLVGIN
jgi:Fe2+ transport system protein FeoA